VAFLGGNRKKMDPENRMRIGRGGYDSRGISGIDKKKKLSTAEIDK
jgi:hypothetical protein